VGKRAFETIRDVESYLAVHTDYERMRRFLYHERTFNLARTEALLENLGNPQACLRSVHVAGTKGKGSTSHMLAAALEGSGIRTGLFTSPHLVCLSERIRIGPEPISEPALCRAFEEVVRAAETLEARGENPTFFEILTAAAAEAFAQASVEWAVFEVGLGGRLDATNAMTHDACVITRIGLDHTHVLGGTVEEIASEKAGILKGGAPCVCAAQTPTALPVLREAAHRGGSKLWEAGRELKILKGPVQSFAEGPSLTVTVRTPVSEWKDVCIPLAGEHQAENLLAALGAADLLRTSYGARVDTAGAKKALGRLRLHGRVDTIRSTPRIVLDVAHNPEAVRALLAALEAGPRPGRLLAVLALSADKDAEGMLRLLIPRADVLFCTTAGTPRSVAPDVLGRTACDLGARDVRVEGNPRKAFSRALDETGEDDLLVITGSFYIAGLAYQYFEVPAF
jgi:dihydrofolate synthase/folylpolyglutamate synthase